MTVRPTAFILVASGDVGVSSKKNCPEDNGLMPLNLFMEKVEKIIKGARSGREIIMDDRNPHVSTMGFNSPLATFFD